MQKYTAKNELVQAIDNLTEMFGEQELLREWIIYATTDELQGFVEHCEEIFKVESMI